jgi:hypothetical protein
MSEVFDQLKLLREPFPDNQINLLPKPYQKDAQKGNCPVCNGYHGLPAAHLPYVGHAALTARLLDVDPEWSWEPLATGTDGLPVFDKNGGLWIRLTIAGITRLGYGDAQGKSGGNAVKEAIGDALRNAGMRFGAALDLWHKGDLYDGAESQTGHDTTRDWLAEAEALPTADGVLNVWREAKANGAPVGVLDKIAVLGRERREAEEDPS